MKGILAAIATAAILAAGATAGVEAVTPTQFAALSKRVTALEKENATLKGQVTCVLKGWNAQLLETYFKPTVHFASSNSDLTVFAVPSSDSAGPYLVTSPTIMPQC